MKKVTYKCMPTIIHIRIASSLVPSQSGTGCHWIQYIAATQKHLNWHYQNYLHGSSLSDAGKWPTHKTSMRCLSAFWKKNTIDVDADICLTPWYPPPPNAIICHIKCGPQTIIRQFWWGCWVTWCKVITAIWP